VGGSGEVAAEEAAAALPGEEADVGGADAGGSVRETASGAEAVGRPEAAIAGSVVSLRNARPRRKAARLPSAIPTASLGQGERAGAEEKAAGAGGDGGAGAGSEGSGGSRAGLDCRAAARAAGKARSISEEFPEGVFSLSIRAIFWFLCWICVPASCCTQSPTAPEEVVETA
jgi:hypothetical protein